MIVETDAFSNQCIVLCGSLGITRALLDDMLMGLTGSIAADPMAFPRIGESDAFGAVLRGRQEHPKLIVVYTYNLTKPQVQLEWIGTVAGAVTISR
ncbi:MAG TPA: hypothetical protein VMW47_12355 [Verrucomicrobiae bacterium]|nr:hypothetical protein [Verrucomicrobiae bacterium]